MKKIMFFIPRMGGGGAERVVANLANEFVVEGNDVLIYTPTTAESFYVLDEKVRIEGENLYISKKKLLRSILMVVNGIRTFFLYRRKIRTENPDVIISFLTLTNLIAVLAKNRNSKLIVSERADPTRYNKFIQCLIKLLYKRADVLVCQSHEVAKYFGYDTVKVIPNPLNINVLPEVYTGMREKEIVAVGRLARQKNFKLLIHAYAALPDEWKNYVLKIYGEGPLRNELQMQIDELGLSKKVFLMGEQKEVTYLYKKASLFVMTSDYEGYPNALVEAMAMGLPVICTDFRFGVARELLTGRDGRLVPVNDKDALTDAIEWVLSIQNHNNEFGKKNSEIRNVLAVESIAKEWIC